jgi:hypothetical protein
MEREQRSCMLFAQHTIDVTEAAHGEYCTKRVVLEIYAMQHAIQSGFNLS